MACLYVLAVAGTAREAKPVLLTSIPITGIHAPGSFSYDIGYVDTELGRYLIADRTNAAVDVIDIASNRLVRQVKGGFRGAGKTNEDSGPNGIVGIPDTSLAYAGDVGGVKIVDFEKGIVTKAIPIARAKLRTDEGCYDRDDRLVMFGNPDESTPFATWISTKSERAIASLRFAGSTGLEQCYYYSPNKAFLVNNDGPANNPNGEVDVIPVASILSAKPLIKTRFPTPGCPVAGMALGPADELLIGCSALKGSRLRTLILNASTGKILKTITQVGGEDQVAYDSTKRIFYTASRDMTSTGIAGSGRSTPVLGVIDAATMTWIENVPTGRNAHSVAADRKTNHVFVPVPPTSTASGGINVYGYP